MNVNFSNSIYNDFIDASLQLDMDETSFHSQIPSLKEIKQKYILNAEKNAIKIFEIIEAGWNVLLNKEKYNNCLNNTKNKIFNKLNEIKNIKNKENLSSFFKEEIKNFWGISTSEREQLYQTSKNLLEKKCWEEAYNLNYLLIILFPQISEFWTNLGIIEKYFFNSVDSSLACFMQAYLLNPNSVIACIYILECYIELNNYYEAKKILDIINKMEIKEEGGLLNHRIENLKTLIKNN